MSTIKIKINNEVMRMGTPKTIPNPSQRLDNLSGVKRIASLLILTFLALILFGCGASISTTMPGHTAPAAGNIESENQAYAFAQATMDYGQRQLLDLSRKATEVSLNMDQAANAAAQSTQDFNQRQQMELDYQATVVSLNMAQAAATQKFIIQQTKMAGDATAKAQSSAAAATQSALRRNVTQTAQAQAILDTQGVQTAQAVAALKAYPLTATPFALTKAALLMQQYDREQQSFLNKVVIPLIPVLVSVDTLLIILGIVLIYRQYRHRRIPWFRRLGIAGGNDNSHPINIIDGVMAEHDPQLQRIIPAKLTPANPPRLPGENMLHVEIVDATEPPFDHWIAEVEHQLATKGDLSL